MLQAIEYSLTAAAHACFMHVECMRMQKHFLKDFWLIHIIDRPQGIPGGMRDVTWIARGGLE